MTLATALAALALIGTPLGGVTLHVDDDAPGDPGPGNAAVSDPAEDGSATHPFDQVQEAIAAANDGDSVLVAPGTYFENISFLGKEITVESSKGPEITVIDGGRATSVVRFVGGEGPDAVLQGFTIRNGSHLGGGGGVLCSSSSPTIRDNIITGNLGEPHGGGLRADLGADPTIVGNVVCGNSGGGAGGMLVLNSGALLAGNTFCCNEAILDPGGALIIEGSRVHVEDNRFTGNASFGPGAIAIGSGSQVRLTRNVISSNVPFRSGTGGGILVARVQAAGSVEIDNCVIADNAGGGLFVFGTSPIIRHCTISGNDAPRLEGDGIHVLQDAAPVITHTILWNNGGPNGTQIFFEPGSMPAVSFCDVQGGFSGAGNISVDPGFVNALIGDYHLSPTSRCRNAGDPSFVPRGGETDFEGEPRLIGPRVDIGGDEFRRPGDATGDDVVNIVDLLAVLSSWGACVDPCPADLDHNGTVDIVDLLAVLSDWGP